KTHLTQNLYGLSPGCPLPRLQRMLFSRPHYSTRCADLPHVTGGAGKSIIMCARIGFFLLLLLLPVTIVSGWCQQISSASDEVLTLDQAIALALRENHSVRDAELEAGKTGDI